MIQRPQSIFLLIVIACEIFVLTGVNIWSKTNFDGNEVFVTIQHWQQTLNGKVVKESSHLLLTALLGASTILSIGILFNYKNRMRQMMMGLINSMLIAGTVGYGFYIVFKETIPLFSPEQNGKYDLGFYALVIALLGNMIANRLIRKDEMLVRSSDRMR
jgi:Domain of unknown function (DUF4293)